MATVSATLDEGLRAMTTAVLTVRDGGAGNGSDAAVAHADGLTVAGNHTCTALVSLADTVVAASGDLVVLCARAMSTLETARSDGFLVFDDGRVQAPTVQAGELTQQAINRQQDALNATSLSYP